MASTVPGSPEDRPTAVDAPAPATEPDLVDLGLPRALLDAVLDLGFTRPTPIQAEAIPPLLAGRDLTGVAQTGTGKTAAFGLPLLAAVDPAVGEVQALVLTPTRELAMQVAEALESFARNLRGLTVVPVYGGAPFLPQQRALARGAQVVVGTPGRVIDHLDRRTLKLDAVRFLVLDEADEMLRMGFAEDVESIVSRAPAERQVALFSATMPPPIVRVAAQHLTDPVRVEVSRQSSTVANVRQTFAVVPHRHKTGALARVLAVTDAPATIVFTRTRGAADEVGAALVAKGLSAATISGDVAQKDRERIVERLRAGTLDVLVATDVAARGLDVDRIGLVVNFDVPTEPESYVHRIGRTGRAGRTGQAMTFVTPHEQGRLRSIERTIRQRLEEVTVPTPAQVSEHRVKALLGRSEERLAAGRLEMYRELVERHVAEHDVTLLDVTATLAALAVGDDGPGSRAEEIEPTALQQNRGARRGDDGRISFTSEERARTAVRRAATGTRYRLAVGRNHGARPEAIVGAITGEGGLRGKDLGKIEIFASFSLVEITADLTPEAFRRIGGAKVAGRALRIQVDQGPRARTAARTTAHPGTHHRSGRPTTAPQRRPRRSDHEG
ncbi:DEAD/DEAH box helicase [Cellulomonas bogoriensis]|uniref:RNA helicase n=1 Tax=Cellulomonas bogoriensis 69B4 = DSM 16987 TaxID=1386082 RepID=A0A0A0C1Y2_9CELL|nr:DEAD/DEAH box helicase [Cellulomonas bogoriensis]KGM13394.1 DNA helicase [Cellulomonas bogoriensis 69B4 = DSM 16987]